MGKHILVVEDDPGTQMLLTRLLMRIDRTFQVCRASSAEEGFHALLDARDTPTQFDLVIADLSLPGSNGLVLWESAQRRFEKVPFLFISGTSYQNWFHRIYPIGKKPVFLQKPITEESLRAYFANRLFPTEELSSA